MTTEQTLAKLTGAFGVKGAEVGPTSLTLPERMTWKVWTRLGGVLGDTAGAIQFWTGDWVLYGEGRFGERHAQALAETGLEEHTLLNWTWVSRAVPPERRLEGLTWSHHEVVAKLTPEAQTMWLQRALDGDLMLNNERIRWSTKRLRKELKESEPPRQAALPGTEPEPLYPALIVGDRVRVGELVYEIGSIEAVDEDGEECTAHLKRLPPEAAKG